MKCPACGRENRAAAGFCAWCGAHLTEAKGPTVPDEHEAPVIGDSGATPAAPIADEPVATTLLAESEHSPATPSGAAAEPPPEPQATPPAAGTGAPHPPDAVIDDRYRVVALIESSADSNRYRAVDLRRCAGCGEEVGDPPDEYCQKCGAALAAPCYVTIVELVRQKPERFDSHLAVGDRDYFITLEPAQPTPKAGPTVADAQPSLYLNWGRATDKGLQRDHNEDYLDAWLLTSDKGGALALFIVADGLGGQDSGEVASRMATETIWRALRESVWQPVLSGEIIEPAQLEERVGAAVRIANQGVYEARLERHSEMSTTVTLALVVNGVAYIANVGDSRTYLWNAAGLRRITKDHSLVQRLVDTGMIQPKDVYSHPQRNLIYQSIGDRPEVTVDLFQHVLADGDHLILCSDGLWEMVHDDGLEEVLLAEPNMQAACDRLLHNANLAGGEDNITVIIAQAAR